jgi:inner membrane protein
MDPLTHGLLGAAYGQARHGEALGRRALVWGAVLAMAPDVDVVLNLTGPFAEWRWHRGITHSLWFVLLAGALAGLWLHRWRGGSEGGVRGVRRSTPRNGGPRRRWIELGVVAMLTHPLLDAATTYGTQLMAPFSSRRFAFDAIAIVDPAYSFALVAGIVAGLRAGVASPEARRAGWSALTVSTLYLAAGLAINLHIEDRARRQLRAEGVAFDQLNAYPTLLQLPYRRVVARSGGEVRVGFVTLLRPRPIQWEAFTQATGPEVEAARATPEVRLFEWFAMGEATPRVERSGALGRVELDDLRYGLPGRPRDGLWGVRVELDASGRPTGPPERFDRELPGSVSSILLTLWRETLGLS